MTPGERGYSLIELMVVVLVIGILAGMAALTIGFSRPASQADGAARVVMAELNAARELAVAQRRTVRVDFNTDSSLTVTRVEVPSGETELRSVGLEAGIRFGLADGAEDTPDGFGIDEAYPESLTFNSDGMLVDSGGNPINRSVYLLRPDLPFTQRAVTILGSTGRVRAYRWVEDDEWMRL